MRSTTIFEIEGLLLNGGHAQSNEGDDYDFTPELVKKIYDNMKAFRTDQNLWFRVAENTFDNFNFSMSAQGR